MKFQAILADIVGSGRDRLVAAWCLMLIHRHMERGNIAGPAIDADAIQEYIDACISGGMPKPSQAEVRVGLVFVRKAHPEYALTPRGDAAADLLRLVDGAGEG